MLCVSSKLFTRFCTCSSRKSIIQSSSLLTSELPAHSKQTQCTYESKHIFPRSPVLSLRGPMTRTGLIWFYTLTAPRMQEIGRPLDFRKTGVWKKLIYMSAKRWAKNKILQQLTHQLRQNLRNTSWTRALRQGSLIKGIKIVCNTRLRVGPYLRKN